MMRLSAHRWIATCAAAIMALTPVMAAVPSGLPQSSLAAVYHGRLKMGSSIEAFELDGADGALLASQFDSVVAENAMKPSRIQPEEGRFDFGPADAIANFARAHGMSMRGHTLLWYKRTPEWFWSGADGRAATREQVLARLQRHINAVVGRYRTVVYAWDVVNEVVDPAQPGCLRNDRWLQVVGPDYLDWAFRYAHAAAPDARLFINDYATTEPARRECLLRIVKGLQARAVPVSGMGHQMHVSLFAPTVGSVEETLTAFARLGLENQITEFDMSIYQPHSYFLADTVERLLTLQGTRYAAMMTVFLAHRDVTAVTWWGVSDAHTYTNSGWAWWRVDRPLLFDDHQRPKPAYYAIVNAVQRRGAGR